MIFINVLCSFNEHVGPKILATESFCRIVTVLRAKRNAREFGKCVISRGSAENF